jgi:hypothetical protein
LPHSRARKYPEHIVNRNSGQIIGYLARLSAILCGQRFSIFAAGTDCAVIQDFNLKE